MRKEFGLTGKKRFSQIYRNSRFWSNGPLSLRALPNELKRVRFGVVAGKRVGNAVIRNKVKRRLREVLRHTSIESGWDLIVVARKGSSDHGYYQLRRTANSLLTRAGLLRYPHQTMGNSN